MSRLDEKTRKTPQKDFFILVITSWYTQDPKAFLKGKSISDTCMVCMLSKVESRHYQHYTVVIVVFIHRMYSTAILGFDSRLAARGRWHNATNCSWKGKEHLAYDEQ